MRSIYIQVLFSALFFCCKDSNIANAQNNELQSTELAIEFKTIENVKLYAGSLQRVDSFPSKFIVPRPVDIWLPKNYDNSKKYSVLYMHDGQMLFDSTTTWNKQEWKVDEWATKLMDEKKVTDFIVVAIHNIPDIRWQDLFPEKAFSYIEKSKRETILKEAENSNFNINFKGDDYLRFIVEELKPVIDQQFSVSSDRKHTSVMGSSMGGLMSMYALSEYPNVFGSAACVSTHWVGAMPMPKNPFPDAIFSYMKDKLPQAGHHKLYFDYGNKTLDQHYPQYAPQVDAILKLKGYAQKDSRNLFFEGTDHSENSWNRRLDQPLTFIIQNDED